MAARNSPIHLKDIYVDEPILHTSPVQVTSKTCIAFGPENAVNVRIAILDLAGTGYLERLLVLMQNVALRIVLRHVAEAAAIDGADERHDRATSNTTAGELSSDRLNDFLARLDLDNKHKKSLSFMSLCREILDG